MTNQTEASLPPLPLLAWRDVIAERRRQIEREGWTPDHDDEHDDGSLAVAAACYAAPRMAATHWPWSAEDYKPKDRRRNLVRAGALILAEIERLDRRAGRLAAHTAVARSWIAPECRAAGACVADVQCPGCENNPANYATGRPA